MAHRFTLTIEVELERVEGKFASRDDMLDALIEETESAQPSELYGLGVDGDSTYTISIWEVTGA